MSDRRWTHEPTDYPGIYHLVFAGRPAAECYWFHNPSHPSVTMTRIVDRLNLPAADCAPSPDPTWSMVDMPPDREKNPGAWRTYRLNGVDVMAVIWKRQPTRIEGWHQRILDALNTGRGLPAVDIPSSPAAGPQTVHTTQGEQQHEAA